jgi:hypothetical protein
MVLWSVRPHMSVMAPARNERALMSECLMPVWCAVLIVASRRTVVKYIALMGTCLPLRLYDASGVVGMALCCRRSRMRCTVTLTGQARVSVIRPCVMTLPFVPFFCVVKVKDMKVAA